MGRIHNPDGDGKEPLDPSQRNVTGMCGMERPHSGRYCDFVGKGTYRCACCGNNLFSSDTKFNSHTGWASFWGPYEKQSVSLKKEWYFFCMETEVRCAKCDAPLGYVFDYNTVPTGKRYCVNSSALEFFNTENA